MDMATVPHLTKSRIVLTAAIVLREYEESRGYEIKPPIAADELIELFLKLNFEIDDLQHILGMNDVLGATWIDERRVVIDERVVANEGRFNFTCAHEVGHWFLHRPLIELRRRQLSLFDRNQDAPTIVCRKKARRLLGERQADLFASCLLMPERFVREAFQKAFPKQQRIVLDWGKRNDVNGAQKSHYEAARWYASRVREAGNFGNVSNHAMAYRLNGLKLIIYRRDDLGTLQTNLF